MRTGRTFFSKNSNCSAEKGSEKAGGQIRRNVRSSMKNLTIANPILNRTRRFVWAYLINAALYVIQATSVNTETWVI